MSTKKGKVYKRKGKYFRKIGKSVVHVRKDGTRDFRYKENKKYQRKKKPKFRSYHDPVKYNSVIGRIVLQTDELRLPLYIKFFDQKRKTDIITIQAMVSELGKDFYDELKEYNDINQDSISPEIMFRLFVDPEKRVTLLWDETKTNPFNIDLSAYFFDYF